jgi:hypothetical protein
MNTHVSNRRYHSVAALLPSGHVVSAGGMDDHGTARLDAHTVEVYSPPYMYAGARPTILGVDKVTAPWGGDINLTVDLPGGVPDGISPNEYRVALIRPGSVTHAFDCSQRYIVVHDDTFQTESYDVGTDTWTIPVTLPLAERKHPPGWYMVVVTTEAGVPSEAAWIKIG